MSDENNNKKKFNIAKETKKKFYRVFNDKSALRRVIFSGSLVVLPTLLMSNLYLDDPSKTTQSTEQSKAPIYQAEMNDLVKKVNMRINDKSLPAQVDDFAYRLTMDTTLTEQEVKDLTLQYRNQAGDILPSRTVNWLEDYAAYIYDAREAVEKNPETKNLTDQAKAKAIRDQMFEERLSDGFYANIIAYALFFSMLERWLKAGLRRGRRRDDEFIVEEKKEKFDEATDALKDALKPSKQVPPPKP